MTDNDKLNMWWFCQLQNERAKRDTEVKLWRFIALGLVLAVLAACLLSFVTGLGVSDLAWCIDNYQVDKIPHCM